MNYWWLVSGVLALFTAAIHLFAGHVEIIKPFVKSDLARIPRATIHACWHMVTLILFGSSFLLLLMGYQPEGFGSTVAAWFMGLQFIGYSIVFLVFAFAGNWKTDLLRLPQWTLLFPIGVLSIIGAISG